MTATRLIVVALTGLLAALPASPVLAQKATLDSRLEVRFEATPAADVFRSIVSGLGLELQLDPKVQGPVTIWVKDVSARTALNVVCESLGCQWHVNGTRLIVSQRVIVVGGTSQAPVHISVAKKTDASRAKGPRDLLVDLKKPLPVDMQFNDVPVSTVLRAMSEVSGIEITTEEPLASKRVTLSGSGKTVEDALKAVIEQAGGWNVSAAFRLKVDAGDDKPQILIAIKPRADKK